MIWAELEKKDCPCQGTGWALREEGWEECFLHFEGQLHPNKRKQLLTHSPSLLKIEEKRSHLRWKIRQSKALIKELSDKLIDEQYHLSIYERDLIGHTPTLKIKAVLAPENELICQKE